MRRSCLLALLAAHVWPAQAGAQARNDMVLDYDRQVFAQREAAGPMMEKEEAAPPPQARQAMIEAPARARPVLMRSLPLGEDLALGIGRFAIHAPPRPATNVEPLRASAESTVRDGSMAAVGLRMSF